MPVALRNFAIACCGIAAISTVWQALNPSIVGTKRLPDAEVQRLLAEHYAQHPYEPDAYRD